MAFNVGELSHLAFLPVEVRFTRPRRNVAKAQSYKKEKMLVCFGPFA
jgi:hypothetical protein